MLTPEERTEIEAEFPEDGGTRISYDFTDQFVSPGVISTGRLLRSRSYFAHAWDCCGMQFNYGTFKAGLRNESAFSVTVTSALVMLPFLPPMAPVISERRPGRSRPM